MTPDDRALLIQLLYKVDQIMEALKQNNIMLPGTTPLQASESEYCPLCMSTVTYALTPHLTRRCGCKPPLQESIPYAEPTPR